MSTYLNSGAPANIHSWLCIADEDKTDLHQPRYNFTYQQRNAVQAGGGGGMWMELWPCSRGMSGDSTISLYPLGMDAAEGGRFEWQSSISRGMVRPYFLRGQIRDPNGNGVSGATVKAYRTADDVLLGVTGTDANGNYELPTIGIGTAHYIVAYNPGNSQAGTSVNTLNPIL